MIENKTKIAVFIAIVNLIFAVSLYSADNNEPIRINADKIEYSETGKKITAENNVKISSGNIIITGNKLESGIDAKYVVASGSVAIFENGSYVSGDRLEYSFATSTGYIYEASGHYSEWFFKSNKVYKDKDAFYLNRSRFTTCDSAKPHYYFLASKAKIIPGKEIRMDNATAYFGVIPAFYFPSYSAQLEERKDVFEAFVGNNSYDGLFLKTKYGMPVSRYSYSKTYLDLFSLQGVGFGEEFNYGVPEKQNGSLYGYYIKEQQSQKERWALMSAHRQKLSDYWSVQGNINFSNNRDFNQYYFNESWNRINMSLKTNFALTRQTANSNLRISAERIDTSTVPGSVYTTESMIAPKIEYTKMTSKAGPLPFYYTFNANLLREEIIQRQYAIWKAQSDISITKDINIIRRRTTLTPMLGVSEYWQDKDDLVQTVTGYYLTRYYLYNTLRQKMGNTSYMDFIHSIQIRSQRGSLDRDYDYSDYGYDFNNINAILFMTLSRSSYLRISDTYNIMDIRNATIDNRLRLTPLVIELNAPISKRIETYTRYSKQELSTITDSIKSIYLETSYSLNPLDNISIGLSYTDNSPGIIQYKHSAAFWLSNKWHIKYSTIFDVTQEKFNFRDNSIEIYRDLHCWELSLLYKKRTGTEFGSTGIDEFFINFSLKKIESAKNNLYDKKHESQYYPWRQ